MDINLPAERRAMRQQLKRACRTISVMMLTVYEDTKNFNALAAGASGYMLNTHSRQELWKPSGRAAGAVGP